VTPSTILLLACLLGAAIGYLAYLISPKCDRCHGQGRVGRCPVCGRVCCRACKPEGAHLCWECWNTKDGKEADKQEAGK
jgi:RecJ-like exonuclease